MTNDQRRSRRGALWLAILVVVTLSAAGCGSGGTSPNVASIGTTTSGGGGATTGSSTAKDVAYAKCMRSHGFPNFPDPSSSGTLTPLPANIDLNSPSYKSAEKACGALFPGFTQAQETAAAQRWLPYAACMRKHGFPNFPDPTGNFVVIPAGVDPHSPLFQNAVKLCQKVKPKTPLAP